MSCETAAENGQNNKSTLQIKQDDKFFCRLLSKEETSISSNASFRVTPVVTVPFLWESHPGTPKHPFSDLSIPPLTPPPSYFYNTTNKSNPINKKISRSNLFRFPFSRFNLRKTLVLPSSISSSLSLSSSSSSPSSSDSSRTVSSDGTRRRRRFSSCDSSVDLWGNSNCDEEDDNDGAVGVVIAADSRNPSSCFGFRRSPSSNGGFAGCYGRSQAN